MLNPYDQLVENIKSHPDETVWGDSKRTLTGREALVLIDHISSLIEKTVGDAGERQGVAILLPRSVEYIAAIFAVWQTGHYFIPLNQRWPDDYCQKIISKAKPAAVISSKDVPGIKTVILDSKAVDLKNPPPAAQKPLWQDRRAAVELAYTIFTSGSTGEQKGVMITHEGYGAYISWTKEFFAEYRENKALLITAELTFDITMGDIAFALAHDVQIHVSPDPRNLIWHAKLIMDRGIDTFYSVPSTINHLFQWSKDRDDVSFDKLKLVISGGDSFAPELIELVVRTAANAHFYNVYGPTEVTINCMATRVDHIREYIRENGGVVPIGFPFKHLRSHLIREENNGIEVSDDAGELVVSGEQCMKGYLGDSDLTDRAFILIGGILFYRTGDLVKRDAKGYHYVLGRIDKLVKVKGYRINPVEIDSVVRQDQRVQDVKTVTFREGESDKQIVCFYVSAAGVREEELLQLCRANLPDYMVPGGFRRIDSIPLGGSGKHDENRLKDIYLQEVRNDKVYAK